MRAPATIMASNTTAADITSTICGDDASGAMPAASGLGKTGVGGGSIQLGSRWIEPPELQAFLLERTTSIAPPRRRGELELGVSELRCGIQVWCRSMTRIERGVRP